MNTGSMCCFWRRRSGRSAFWMAAPRRNRGTRTPTCPLVRAFLPHISYPSGKLTSVRFDLHAAFLRHPTGMPEACGSPSVSSCSRRAHSHGAALCMPPACITQGLLDEPGCGRMRTSERLLFHYEHVKTASSPALSFHADVGPRRSMGWRLALWRAVLALARSCTHPFPVCEGSHLFIVFGTLM